MGGLNAKIRSENTCYKEMTGKHELVLINENGELLTHFWAMNSVFFDIKQYIKQCGYQTDHICKIRI